MPEFAWLRSSPLIAMVFDREHVVRVQTPASIAKWGLLENRPISSFWPKEQTNLEVGPFSVVGPVKGETAKVEGYQIDLGDGLTLSVAGKMEPLPVGVSELRGAQAIGPFALSSLMPSSPLGPGLADKHATESRAEYGATMRRLKKGAAAAVAVDLDEAVRLVALKTLLADIARRGAMPQREVPPEVVALLRIGADVKTISATLGRPLEQVELDLLALSR